MAPDRVFRWTWDVPASWAEEVHRLSYRGDRLSYLTLHWVPGVPTEPMQRWVVFEMVPFHAAIGSNWLRMQVNAVMANPHGQAMHHWVAQQILTRQVVPTPFWVIQGAHGGHKLRYTNEDREFALWQGMPGEPPGIGDLPYAPWSALTAHWLRLHSLLARARHGTFDAERTARTKALQQECRRLMWHSIHESGVTDLAADAAPLLYADARHVERDHARARQPAAVGDLSAVQAKHIETGQLDPRL